MTTLEKARAYFLTRFSVHHHKNLKPPATKCVLKPGIGLCDECGLPKLPQRYIGYGVMLCLDCIAANEVKRATP